MKPGRFEEHPIPLTVTTSWGRIWSSTSAFSSDDNTPKSPQPGHQSGSIFPLKSASVSFPGSGSTTVAMSPPHLMAARCQACIRSRSSNHNLVHRHRQLRFARKLLSDGFDNVMGHERLAVVFADISVGNIARLAS